MGTHIDAPIHMVEGGSYIAEIPLDHCEGRGVLLDVRGKGHIGTDILDGHDIRSGDIILLWTDFSEKYRESSYFDEWPVMTVDLAQTLVKKEVAMVGMDTAGPEMDETFPVHKELLSNNVLIVENLTNLRALEGHDSFLVRAQPMKYHASGAPARVYAEILEE